MLAYWQRCRENDEVSWHVPSPAEVGRTDVRQ
jgi:hypothetical protein